MGRKFLHLWDRYRFLYLFAAWLLRARQRHITVGGPWAIPVLFANDE